MRIIIHCKKSLLYNGTNPWKKKNHRKLLWRYYGRFWWCQNLRVFRHPYKTLANLCVFFQKIYRVDLIYILRSGAGSFFFAPYTCHVSLMAPGNVPCHHDRDLMGHFKFLHGSRMICLPLNISEKYIYVLTTSLRKTRRDRDSSTWSWSIQYKTHAFKSNIDHSSKRGPATFFHTDDNPALGHFVVHSADKTHGLVSVLSLNFVPTLNISLSFRRFRRSYVNHPVVVPTRYCQSCTAYA